MRLAWNPQTFPCSLKKGMVDSVFAGDRLRCAAGGGFWRSGANSGAEWFGHSIAGGLLCLEHDFLLSCLDIKGRVVKKHETHAQQELQPVLMEMGEPKGHTRQASLVALLAQLAAAPWTALPAEVCTRLWYAFTARIRPAQSVDVVCAGTQGAHLTQGQGDAFSAGSRRASSLMEYAWLYVFDKPSTPAPLRWGVQFAWRCHTHPLKLTSFSAIVELALEIVQAYTQACHAHICLITAPAPCASAVYQACFRGESQVPARCDKW